MTRTFHKMHGLGNDFVIFDAREEPLSMDEPLARAISDRKTGVGCDQLIVLEKSTVADLRMRIWNHDGIEVESCGNASRCVVALTHAKTIETGGGLVTATMPAKMEVRGLKIDPSLMKPDEAEVLEDLIVAALNDARRKAEAAMQEKVSSLTGGLPLPPGLGFS